MLYVGKGESMGGDAPEDISDRIRTLLEAQPFRPFRVRTSDGSNFEIERSWQAMLTSLTLHVYNAESDHVFYIALTEIVYATHLEEAVS